MGRVANCNVSELDNTAILILSWEKLLNWHITGMQKSAAPSVDKVKNELKIIKIV
jgi:hypothetical protein